MEDLYFNLFEGPVNNFLGWPSQALKSSKYKPKDLCNSTMFSFQEANQLKQDELGQRTIHAS